MVTDADRLLTKMRNNGVQDFPSLPDELQNGLSRLVEKGGFSFNAMVSRSVLISIATDEFVLTFKNPELTGKYLSELLNGEFNLASAFNNEKLTVDGESYNLNSWGDFLTVSSNSFSPLSEADPIPTVNPDYIVFGENPDHAVYHIISSDYHFRVWESDHDKLKGKPLDHQVFFNKAPAVFDQMKFYGSTRFQEDAQVRIR